MGGKPDSAIGVPWSQLKIGYDLVPFIPWVHRKVRGPLKYLVLADVAKSFAFSEVTLARDIKLYHSHIDSPKLVIGGLLVF
jgi:hypothetical protein